MGPSVIRRPTWRRKDRIGSWARLVLGMPMPSVDMNMPVSSDVVPECPWGTEYHVPRLRGKAETTEEPLACPHQGPTVEAIAREWESSVTDMPDQEDRTKKPGQRIAQNENPFGWK